MCDEVTLTVEESHRSRCLGTKENGERCRVIAYASKYSKFLCPAHIKQIFHYTDMVEYNKPLENIHYDRCSVFVEKCFNRMTKLTLRLKYNSLCYNVLITEFKYKHTPDHLNACVACHKEKDDIPICLNCNLNLHKLCAIRMGLLNCPQCDTDLNYSLTECQLENALYFSHIIHNYALISEMLLKISNPLQVVYIKSSWDTYKNLDCTEFYKPLIDILICPSDELKDFNSDLDQSQNY